MAFGIRTLSRRVMMSAKGRGQIYEDVTKTIGNTPVVKISPKLCPPDVEVYAKCEYFNPLSSVKDRLALAIIQVPRSPNAQASLSPRSREPEPTPHPLSSHVAQDAEARGELKKGDTVVEATSGNTGIAVAMVCAQHGYDCVICMAEPFSVERRKLMRMCGTRAQTANFRLAPA